MEQQLEVQRWTRYGNDRLYVRTASGYEVGHLDRRTGVRVLDDEAWRAAFDVAVAGYEATIVVPAPASAGDLTLARPDVEPPWVDLAPNEPGQGVRAKAKELQHAAPVATFLARVLGVHTDERAWRLGDNGEVAVANQLARLDSSWRTLHSVPVGGGDSDIDHVVIGPAGVFTVNAKNHPDASVWVRGDGFLVNGQRVPYIRNSRHEAHRAARLLAAKLGYSVPVIAVVAVCGAQGGLTIREQPRDRQVVVVKRYDIVPWLLSRQPMLSAEQIDAIYDIARRSTTWLTPEKPPRKRR